MHKLTGMENLRDRFCFINGVLYKPGEHACEEYRDGWRDCVRNYGEQTNKQAVLENWGSYTQRQEWKRRPVA